MTHNTRASWNTATVRTFWETLDKNKLMPANPNERKRDSNGMIRDLIPPISRLVFAALLKFKPEGTTVEYSQDLTLYAQSPHDYQIPLLPKGYNSYRGLVRQFKKLSRDDLDMFPRAIEQLALLFDFTLRENNAIRELCEWAKPGLAKLGDSYASQPKPSTIPSDAAKTWIARIDTLLKNRGGNILRLNGSIEKIQTIWSKEDILRANGLFEQMKKKDEEKQPYEHEVEQLELLLRQKNTIATKVYLNILNEPPGKE